MEYGAPPELINHMKIIHKEVRPVGFSLPDKPHQLYHSDRSLYPYRDQKHETMFHYHFKINDPNWPSWYESIREEDPVLLIVREGHETYRKENYTFKRCARINGKMYMILSEN
tara:strand:+ start:17882 stop:18220 length:339 start_codon:yes stop_codon:yes gene_type:complete